MPSTSPESQAHLGKVTPAEMPSSMKMTVSAQLARVFMVYLTAVRDLWEMLASTYFLQPRPHIVTLGEEWRVRMMRRGRRKHSLWGLSMHRRGCPSQDVRLRQSTSEAWSLSPRLVGVILG